MSTQNPSLAAMGQVDIPLEAAESSEPLKRAEKEIVKRIMGLRDKAKQHASSRHTLANRMWALYRSRYDWQGKAVWQSRVPIPRMFSILENACAVWSGALVPNGRWFTLEDEWGEQNAQAIYNERLMRRNLRHTGFYTDLRLILMAGLVGGLGPVKIGVDNTGPFPEVSTELWDMRDFYLDWSGRGRFVIAETEVDVYALREWAEDGMLEESRVARAVAHDKPEPSPYDTDIKTVHLTEFWGDLIDENGELIMGNCHALIANDGVLLRPPIENPYRHKKPPYILFAPLRIPYFVYPSGLAEHISGMARMLTELANAVMDSTMFASVQAYQYDIDRVTPEDLVRGVYPGKAFGVENLREGPGIAPLKVGEVPMDAMSVMGWLDNEMQRDTAVTETLTGVATPGSRRKTAREVVSNQGASMAVVRAMAADIERAGLEPMLDMMLSVFAQVTSEEWSSFTRPDIVKALGKQAVVMLLGMQPEDRYQVLTEGIRHKANGISSSIAMNEDLQRLMALAEALHRAPEMWQMVNPRKLAERLVIAHRLTPEDVLLSEEELQAKIQKAMMEQRAAQMAAMGQMGGGPPAAPGPGGPPLRPSPGGPRSLQMPAARPTLIPGLRPPIPGEPRAIPRLSPNVVTRYESIMAEKMKPWRKQCIAIIKAAIAGEDDPEELRKMAYTMADLQPPKPYEAMSTMPDEPMPVRVVKGGKWKPKKKGK